MKTIRIFRIFFLFLIAGLLGCNEAGKRSQERPNIILIMSDDMGYECLSCNGALSYSTPELDKLAENGLRFTHCYSQPLCTPSRVKIMTGRYNSNNYVDFGYLDVNEKTFGNILQDTGYNTMIAGKWQLNGVKTREEGYMDMNRPYQFGFDEYCLWWLTEAGSRYSQPVIVQNGNLLETTIDDYGPDIVSDYIVNFIERNRDEPFFVYYPMILVHSPHQPTPDSPEWKNPDQRMKQDDNYFKDMVEYSDKIVGKIVRKLKEEGLLENTIILFTGDNGTNTDIVTQTTLGPYKGGKGHLLDNGTHVPLVLHWPDGGIKNEIATGLIEFSDFVPTFADAANTAIPETIDGTSFFNLIANRRFKPRESVFVHYFAGKTKGKTRNGCFVRTAGYKLYSDGRFYDMVKDKWEKDSLDIRLLSGEDKEVYDQLSTELIDKPVWDFSDTLQNN